jgi:iron(III) transport system substrate-binding protein
MQLPAVSRRNLLGLSVLGGHLGPVWAQEQRVTLYASLNELGVRTALELARKVLPDIKVTTVTGGSVPLLRRMQAEAARPQCDVYWTATASAMESFKSLFDPYLSPEASAIPAALHGPQHLWMATHVNLFLPILNTARIEGEPPASWADLTAPSYRGRILVADPGDSTTAFTTLWGIEQVLGATGLRKLAVTVVTAKVANDVAPRVSQGEFAVGFVNEAMGYPHATDVSRGVRLMYPKEGAFLVIDHLGLARNAPHPSNARKLVDLLLSRPMQIEMLEKAFRRPSRGDIEMTQHSRLPALPTIKVVPTDEVAAAVERDAFVARWQAIVRER